MIEIYCDGSCRGNGSENSSGGYGVVAFENNQIIWMKEERGTQTTNNREEMKALIAALEYAIEKNQPSVIYSDSAYCINLYLTWMYSWADNGWTRGAKKEEVLNLDLVKELYRLAPLAAWIVRLEKVKGHAGIKGNEIADSLAQFGEISNELIDKYGAELFSS